MHVNMAEFAAGTTTGLAGMMWPGLTGSPSGKGMLEETTLLSFARLELEVLRLEVRHATILYLSTA